MNKNLLVLSLLAALLLTACVGASAVISPDVKPQIADPTQPDTAGRSACPSAAGDTLLYVDETNGYCFLYPVTFTLQEDIPATVDVTLTGQPLAGDESLEPLFALLTVNTIAGPGAASGINLADYVNEEIAKLYPEGMHGAIAKHLNTQPDMEARTATLDEPEHGLTDEVLANTDVMTWWGHIAHHEVNDEIVAKVHQRVLDGMGLLVLHSGHFSKIFQKLMGTTCYLKWREIGERERLWVVEPGHPIVQGIVRAYDAYKPG